MLRRVNFYSVCFAFCLSVLLILARSRYADTPSYYRPWSSFDKILENTRLNIKVELSNYNFSHSEVNELEDLLMESGGQPIRSVIISTWRSGTTFLGEVLNAVPGNFYHYEPLLKHGIVQIRGPPESNEALSTIKNMLKCDFNGMDEYFKFGITHVHQFTHNTRLWNLCKHKRELCINGEFSSRFCKLFPFQSMKVVRLRLRLVQELLSDKELNVKVVLLIRDPRGVMQSRRHRNFCQPSPDCWWPELLCADMISDYVAASRLMAQYPDRLVVLRYEELALNPNATSHRILKFLRLSATQSFEEFLQNHTNFEVAGVSSTFRVSRDVPFKWKNVLDFKYVDEIQLTCKEAMNLWGYRMAHNATHMASEQFNPLEDYKITSEKSDIFVNYGTLSLTS